ncbi:MAG: PP2C family protein-serine/threonine phosphatase [Frankiaceae bacterium]
MEVLSTAYETGWRLLLPILDGVDRLGVLRLTFPPTVSAPGLRQRCVEFAALLGELLIGKGQYGDALQRVARTETMAIAAEMQWQLLPPLTFGTDRVVITGRVEPCYSVGGDIFDYAVDGDSARFAIFDAMGHGLGAGVLAAVTIAAYRNARRSGRGLTAAVLDIDAVMAEEFGPDKFVTGVLAELDLSSGRFRWVNCGHPHPLLVRGRRTLVPLACPPSSGRRDERAGGVEDASGVPAGALTVD